MKKVIIQIPCLNEAQTLPATLADLPRSIPGIVGLVLTGSFSRGEGTVLAVDGHLRVLGDIEFLVVVPRLTDYRALRRRAQ